MINSLLIVCVGNICRSPAVEKLFIRHLGDSVTLSSAGLGALVGHSVDKHMEQCLVTDGFTNIEHSARQFTRELAQNADLILVMEQEHLQAVQQMAPEVAGKVMLLGRWSENTSVDDPYRHSQEFFEVVYKQMRHYVNQWCSKIS